MAEHRNIFGKAPHNKSNFFKGDYFFSEGMENTQLGLEKEEEDDFQCSQVFGSEIEQTEGVVVKSRFGAEGKAGQPEKRGMMKGKHSSTDERQDQHKTVKDQGRKDAESDKVKGEGEPPRKRFRDSLRSNHIVPVALSREKGLFPDHPRCMDGELKTHQTYYEDSCPCRLEDNGLKYTLTPLKVAVADDALLAEERACCRSIHYKNLAIEVVFGDFDLSVTAKGFLTHAGVTRLLGVEAEVFFARKDSKEEEAKYVAKMESLKMKKFSKLHTATSMTLLAHKKDGLIHVPGVVFFDED